jgi:hypothetical protein
LKFSRWETEPSAEGYTKVKRFISSLPACRIAGRQVRGHA